MTGILRLKPSHKWDIWLYRFSALNENAAIINMKAFGRNAGKCLMALFILVCFEQCAFADGELSIIGTPESFRTLWKLHEAEVRRRMDGLKTRWNNDDKIVEIKARISKITAGLDKGIEVQKDEFETTNQWVMRCADVNKKHKQEMMGEVDGLRHEIQILEKQKSETSKAAPLDEIQLPNEITFVLKVRMGQYNAEMGTIESLEIAGSGFQKLSRC